MRKVIREIASALIWSKDGKLFMGKKDPKNGGVYSECWHIPGGGIDDGEELLEGCIRETKEETGIDVSQYEIYLKDDEGGGECEKTLKDSGEVVLCCMNFNVFEVHVHDKHADEIEISLSDDLVEYKWFTKTEIKNCENLTPPSIELFKRIGIL